MTRPLVVVVALFASLFAVTACGGSDESSNGAGPTSVGSADLNKNGNFWVAQTPDLKDELVEMGKVRLGEERPDGATGIQAYPTNKLVAEIDKQYSNESKRSTTIFSTYTEATNTLAKRQLDDSLNKLDQLCNSEPRPPECDDGSP